MSKLLGDLIADVTSFFGVKPCSACKKRRKKLNELHARARGGGRAPARCAECAAAKRMGGGR